VTETGGFDAEQLRARGSFWKPLNTWACPFRPLDHSASPSVFRPRPGALPRLLPLPPRFCPRQNLGFQDRPFPSGPAVDPKKEWIAGARSHFGSETKAMRNPACGILRSGP
jgi:hypothetical protein